MPYDTRPREPIPVSRHPQAVVSTHVGLLHAAGSETVPAVAQVVLRALCVLMAGSSYDRLPAGLLPQAIDVRGGRITLD